MTPRRVFAVVAVAACCPAAGCLAVYSTRPVDVVVTRTDTGEPAADVPVGVSYLSMLVLNRPADASGTTDATGRVTLPMADFLAGPVLRAGTTQYRAPSETICHGGPLTYKPSANPSEPVPTHAVRLIPRRRSLAERFFGYRNEGPPATTLPPPPRDPPERP